MTRRAVDGCAIGLLAGVAGAATTLLHAIEHLSYHYTFGTLLSGVGWQTSLARGPEPTGACSARV